MRERTNSIFARWGVHVDSSHHVGRGHTRPQRTSPHTKAHATSDMARLRAAAARPRAKLAPPRAPPRPRAATGSASGYPPFPVARGAARPKSASNRDRRSAGGLGGRRGDVINIRSGLRSGSDCCRVVIFDGSSAASASPRLRLHLMRGVHAPRHPSSRSPVAV